MRMITLSSFLLIVCTAQAQAGPKDLKAALAALNGHLAGSAMVKVDHHDRLVIELFHQGSPVRKDQVAVHDIDAASITFVAEEELVSLRCMESAGKCVDKEVMRSGARGPTGRSTLPVPAGDAQGATCVRLLSEVVRIAQELAPPLNSRTKNP